LVIVGENLMQTWIRFAPHGYKKIQKRFKLSDGFTSKQVKGGPACEVKMGWHVRCVCVLVVSVWFARK
jgi:hypothetical protein